MDDPRAGELAGPRILVAHGDADLRMTLVEALEAEGFSVLSAASGDEALELIDRTDVSLVVAHVGPTGSNAADLLAPLEDLRRAAAPGAVGLVSGWKVDEAQASARGFAFALRNPFDIDVFLDKVAGAVGGPPLEARQERVVRAYFAALAAHDWASLAAICADDMRYTGPAGQADWDNRAHGREAFVELARRTFSQVEATFEVRSIVSLPHAVVARYRSTWTTPGGPASVSAAVFFQLREDRVANVRVRLDAAEIRRI